jgi:hypothetical protein
MMRSYTLFYSPMKYAIASDQPKFPPTIDAEKKTSRSEGLFATLRTRTTARASCVHRHHDNHNPARFRSVGVTSLPSNEYHITTQVVSGHSSSTNPCASAFSFDEK